MGTLKTDIIKGQGNNNEVTLLSNKFTGSASGSISLPGEGGTTTTNIQQGLGKAWCHWTQVSTQTIRDSLNVSGITDGGLAKTTLSINNDMANDDWAGSMYQNGANGVGTGDWNNHYAGGFIARATGSVEVVSYSSGLVDSGLVDVIVMGDLA